MDARKFLPFLLLVICTISTVSPNKNNRGRSNNIRHIRRTTLNEYLVPPPPPPPRFNSAGRIGRLANHRPIEAPGYFTQLMNWLNAFDPSSSPPSLQSDGSYPPSSKFIQSPTSAPVPFATIHTEPSLPVYDKPPLALASFNSPTYLFPARAKNCNPCNKVPWMPIHGEPSIHLKDASFASSQLSSLNGDYLPSTNHEISHDVHQAASQEVRAPDFSFVPPLPANGQDESSISLLSNPHLFPGAMPPLFKAEDFNYPVETASDENSGSHHDALPSVSGNSPFAENGSFLHTEPGLNTEYGQSVHPEPLNQPNLGTVHQELKYTNPNANYGASKNFDSPNHGAHDLSSSGTQVFHGHADPVSDQQGLKMTAIRQDSLDTINHQILFGDSTASNHRPSEVFNGYYDVTGSNGPLDDHLSGNSSQIDQNLPSSYGISSLDQAPNNFEHKHNDLFPSSNVERENFHAPLHTSDRSSVKIEDPVHFEKSPLLDFTQKDESRTDSSSIPPTSNAIAGFENVEVIETTLAPRDELFGTQRGIVSTESYLSTDNIRTINSFMSLETSVLNDSIIQNINENLYDSKIGKDVSYISPSNPAGYLWSTLVKSYDDAEKENAINLKDAKTSAKQSVKRNKQVQVIIPYTSQYTPLPFHPLHRTHERKIIIGSSNHDNYIGEESKNRIKVTSPPDASHNTQTWPAISAVLDNITKKPIGHKVNNSIDVHRLQKNIDNWTIQEYSKGTTASTISPSSANPYLFPSKQIPDEYLTTTEPFNHVSSPHDVKAFTLAGFSFNDLEYKASASNHEESRVQIVEIENSKSTESSTDVSTNASTKNDTNWQGFSVDISPSNKERVYVVTPQPIVTSTKSSQIEQKEKLAKEIERNLKDLRKTSDIKKTKKKVPDTFESIEKAYQVLPQAVNNLAVASTGPESVPLWGIMEHEEFASLDQQDNRNNEAPEIPVLYTGHSKVSHGRR